MVNSKIFTNINIVVKKIKLYLIYFSTIIKHIERTGKGYDTKNRNRHEIDR